MKRWIHLPRSFFSTALFLYLIPLIFLLGKYRQTIGTIQPFTFFYCLLLYWLSAFLFAVGFWRIFRDDLKAHLMTAILFLVNCYFGQIQFFLADIRYVEMLSRYRVILPLTFLFLLGCLYMLRKIKINTTRAGSLLSWCCVLFVFISVGRIWDLSKKINQDVVQTLPLQAIKDSTIKPDIFLITTDGYAGKNELKDLLGYDNTPFYDSLRKRGFWVADSSHSNYSITPFSMASLFSMDYFQPRGLYHIDLIEARKRILKNTFVNFLSLNGYSFDNLSIFQGEEGKGNNNLLDAFRFNEMQLLNSGTLLQHLTYLIVATLDENEDFFHIDEETVKKISHSNSYVIGKLLSTSAQKSDGPRVIYGHLLAPHFPYLFDSLGRDNDLSTIRQTTRFSQPKYVSYLKGMNKVLIRILDSIQHRTDHKAVIILLSDHGFRQFKEPQFPRYVFSNLLSIYLPDQHYELFYNQMSNVNFLRVFLNQSFDQHLPLLKDSIAIYPVRGIKFKTE